MHIIFDITPKSKCILRRQRSAPGGTGSGGKGGIDLTALLLHQPWNAVLS